MKRPVLRSVVLLTGWLLVGCPNDQARRGADSGGGKADSGGGKAGQAAADKTGGEGGHRAAKIAAALAGWRNLPQRQDSGPLDWPVTVKVDKNGHAISPKTSSVIPHGREADVAMVRLPGVVGRVQDLFAPRALAKGDGSYTDSSGRVWHPVGSNPGGGGGGGGSGAGVGRDGSRSSYDQDNGETTYHNKNGSTDIIDGGGSITHLHSPAPNDGDDTDYVKNPDGSLTAYKDDGSSSHVSNDGSDDYTDNADGSRTVYHQNGSEDTTMQDGTTFHQGPPGPGDKYENPPSNKPPGDKPAGGTGEPHYITRDGTNVTTQAAGEFVLVSGVAGHEVQARQQPWATSQKASAITALAFKVGGSKVEARLDGTVLIDGQPATDGDFVQGEVPGGGAVGVWRKDGKMLNVAVVWPDLSAAWISNQNSYLNFVLQWRDKAPGHRGLLGSNDEDATNDLTDRGGHVCASDADGIAAFVNSWRVTDAESLFTYAKGESTATYTLKDFPHPYAAPDFKAALASVSGLPEGALRDNCAYDIAVTGDPGFLAGYKDYASMNGAVSGSAVRTSIGRPDVQSVFFITPAERRRAVPLEPNSHVKETIEEGDSKVFIMQPKENADRGAFSNQLRVIEEYKGGPGYAFFDAKGKPYGKPSSVWNDLTAFKFTPGTYYLKLVGPGLVDISVNDYGK